MKAVRKLDNLESAWRVIHENGRTSRSEDVRLELEKFAEDAPHNLRSLKARLGRRSFRFAKAKGIPVPKLNDKGKKTGKIRPIVLAPVESRIVQRAILNVLLEIDQLKPYAKTPYSFGGIRSERQKTGRKSKATRAESLSAVPAAIKAIIDEIGVGARYVACADIQSFFTKISKTSVTAIVGAAARDSEFMALFTAAITVELENLASLRQHSADFPTEDLGVAQGNSLSPLLGNIVLASFDAVMNEGDCRCIRYIDDFIILAPTLKAANARLRKAELLLEGLGMSLAPAKSAKGGSTITGGFDFLGIHISPGLVRPSTKSQQRFISSIFNAFEDSTKSMNGLKAGVPLERSRTLIGTLKRVDGMIDGWGKHYWFCNDAQTFHNLDLRIVEKLRDYLGRYGAIREASGEQQHTRLLGLAELARIEREPFAYPSVKPQHA